MQLIETLDSNFSLTWIHSPKEVWANKQGLQAGWGDYGWVVGSIGRLVRAASREVAAGQCMVLRAGWWSGCYGVWDLWDFASGKPVGKVTNGDHVIVGWCNNYDKCELVAKCPNPIICLCEFNYHWFSAILTLNSHWTGHSHITWYIIFVYFY